MQRWPIYLADVPATLLRLIAAAHRISLPRRSDPAERLARVRRALCRPAAVRTAYFALPPEIQLAAQTLRSLPRTLSPDAVTSAFGPIRPLAELRADRRPRSPAEHLLLRGWLLPRPASRNHPPRYVVPPELRAWLPQPLSICTSSPPPDTLPPPLAATPLALRAASAILAAAACTPLPLRRDGKLSVAARRRLRPLLADLPPATADALTAWAVPLLADLGLLAPHGAAAAPAPAAARFLAAPPAQRLQSLRTAWANAPRPEPALLPPRASQRGLDWPGLRRRLLHWAEALPALASPEPAHSFAQLCAAFGPLADGFTHPYRSGSRPPWNRATAAGVWSRALCGPLAWLGLAGAHSCEPASAEPAGAASPAGRYAEPGLLQLDPVRPGAELLAVAPFARDVAGDAAGLRLQLTRPSVARALGRGHDPARLRAALERLAGPLPTAWEQLLAPAGRLRLLRRTVLLADEPAALHGALEQRALRRTVEAVLAPGVVLAAPGREEALARQLARHGHVVEPAGPPEASVPPPASLTAAEVAALLLASRHYRAVAPPDAPPGPHDGLLERLQAGLPPALAAATEQAITALLEPPRPAAAAAPATPAAPPEARPAELELLWQLREAIRRRGALRLVYQGAADPAPRERTIRPLELERHGAVWLVRAYCLAARAERCFRLDRIQQLVEAEPAPAGRRSHRAKRQRPGRRPGDAVALGPLVEPPARERRAAPRVGFFAPPPEPPPGSPLVGVWLVEEPAWAAGGLDQVEGRVGGELAEPVDGDALKRGGVERIAAHAVGLRVDELAQGPVEPGGGGGVEVALEDAALYAGAVALEQLHHLGAALVVDDVVADQGEHRAPLHWHALPLER